jgi:nucleotide-binding universal stress UspA family protein
LIDKILVAIDGSEISNKALDFALEMAEKYSAILTVLNVYELPSASMVSQEASAISAEGIVGFAKDLSQLHEKMLNNAVDHSKSIKPNIEVLSKLRNGDPAKEIVAEAKEGNFSIIVIGHKSSGRVKEFLGLGGTGEKVAHLAPCPVIIVK